MSSYYIIVSGEDGVIVSNSLTNEEVVERITEEYYGNVYWLSSISGLRFDNEEDVKDGYDRVGLIIKGGVVVPVPKKTVFTYELD